MILLNTIPIFQIIQMISSSFIHGMLTIFEWLIQTIGISQAFFIAPENYASMNEIEYDSGEFRKKHARNSTSHEFQRECLFLYGNRVEYRIFQIFWNYVGKTGHKKKYKLSLYYFKAIMPSTHRHNYSSIEI